MKTIIKIICILILFLCSFCVFSQEQIPKIKVLVFANEKVCWTCIKSLKTINELELKNTKIDVILYFCGENKKIVSDLMAKYNLEIEYIIDDECLYAKKYNIETLPGIVIKAGDSILLKELWQNPKEYVKLIKEYDSKYAYQPKNTLDTNIKLVKHFIFKDTNNLPFQSDNSNYRYNTYNNKYYLIHSYKDTIAFMTIFNDSGTLIKQINLTNAGLEFWNPGFQTFFNDSITMWHEVSRATKSELYYMFNTNTSKLVKCGVIGPTYSDSNSSFNSSYTFVPSKNKIIYSKYFFRGDTMNQNKKLLLMSDTNYSPDYFFGKLDTVCETTTMAANMMSKFNYVAISNDTIYNSMALTNSVFIYDLDGNYIKTIKLNYSDTIPPLINISKIMTNDELNTIYNTYKLLADIFVYDNKIIIHRTKSQINQTTLRREVASLISIFDLQGNLMMDITLPTDHLAMNIIGNTIYTRYKNPNDNTLSVYVYEISASMQTK